MSKCFDGNKTSGYEDSHITYVYGGNLEECHKIISDLETKLADKDEKIKELTECNQCLQIYRNKDKISFAVEQLEKVKNEIYDSEVKFEEIEKLPIALNNYEIGYDKGRFKATNIIDNQIKQLKEIK